MSRVTEAGRPKIAPGTHRIYTEDDWIAEVEVLADKSDAEWYRYELKLVKTINESKMYTPVAIGEVWTADQRVDYGYCWTLEPMPKEAIKA